MQQGYTQADYCDMDFCKRKAIVYAQAVQNGFKIDWSDGSVYRPEEPA